MKSMKTSFLKLSLIFQFNKAAGITQDRLGFPMVKFLNLFCCLFPKMHFQVFVVFFCPNQLHMEFNKIYHAYVYALYACVCMWKWKY